MRCALTAISASILLASVGGTLAGATDWSPGSTDAAEANDVSNFLFASLHALGKPWSQAHAPIPHAVVPATIKAGTRLYHTGPGTAPKAGLEWLSFDPEHSHIFNNLMRPSHLWTFVTNRAVKVLMFDGFSASKELWGRTGTYDLWLAMAYGENWRDLLKTKMGIFDHEWEAAQRICDWVRPFGVEGLIREEPVFEVVWCDFSSPALSLIRENVANLPRDVHKHPDYDNPCPFPEDGCDSDSLDITPSFLPPLPKGSCFFCATPSWMNDYWHSGPWEMWRMTMAHGNTPDCRIIPQPKYMVSLYNSSYRSLQKLHKRQVQEHRLFNGWSLDDQLSFRSEIESMLVQWAASYEDTEIDWSAIATNVVDRHGARLADIRLKTLKFVEGSEEKLNALDVVTDIKKTAYAFLMPYIDHMSIFHPNTTAVRRDRALEATRLSCSSGLVDHLDDAHLTRWELALKRSIEVTMGRICSFGHQVLSAALKIERDARSGDRGTVEKSASELLSGWSDEVNDLMGWLRWAMWNRCDPQCAWDEECYVPMWPMFNEPSFPWAPPYLSEPESLGSGTQQTFFGIDHGGSGSNQERIATSEPIANRTMGWVTPRCIKRDQMILSWTTRSF